MTKLSERPTTLGGITPQVHTSCGTMYVTFNFDDNHHLKEVRFKLGMNGTCVEGLLTHIGILYSIILQSDLDIRTKIKTFKKHGIGIVCHNPFMENGKNYTGCLDWINKHIVSILESEYEDSKS